MGRLVPDDFPLSSLANDAERRVVEAFRDGLTDGWLILPDVGLRAGRDHQLDIVLVHQDWGVVNIEVKGHRMRVRDGEWRVAGSRLEPQPMQQAKDNAFALRRTLQALTPAGVAAIVAALRPDADFHWDPDARARAAQERLDELCANQVAALETLDANRRAYVTGRAGTGKTRLAMGWARRAFVADERALLTCYNDPPATFCSTIFSCGDPSVGSPPRHHDRRHPPRHRTFPVGGRPGRGPRPMVGHWS